MWWSWLGCGPGTAGVDWDLTTGSDAAQDAAVAVLVLGLQETDGGVLRATHPTGSSLTIRALPRSGQGHAGRWHATSEDESVLQVVSQDAHRDHLELELAFVREGSTRLAVVDGDGAVLDREDIEVREVVDADVFSYEDVQRDLVQPLDVLHVVEGAEATFVVSWKAADGEVMAGGDVLSVQGPGRLGAEAGFDGSAEILALSPGDDGAGTATLTLLAAGREVRDVPVTVHERSEVDEVDVEVGHFRVTPIGVDGTVHSVVSAAGTVLSGADVAFSWPDGEATGDTLDFGVAAGPATDVEMCFDAVCRTLSLPSGVVGVSANQGSLEPPLCGCGSAPGPFSALLGGLAALALRRRRR